MSDDNDEKELSSLSRAAAAEPSSRSMETIRSWIGEALDEGCESGSEILGAVHSKSNRTTEVQEVQDALRVEADAIRREMVEVMSSKYGEFYAVAESVSTVTCRETRDELAERHGKLVKAWKECSAEREAREAELSKKRSLRKQEREAEAIERFEQLLRELEQEVASDDTDAERAAHASLALRAQLSSAVELMTDGSRATRLHELSGRVEEAERATVAAVERSFDDLCRSGSRSRGDDEDLVQLRMCLRAAAALGLGRDLEERFASRVGLDTFVAATFTKARLDGSDPGSCSGLPSIYAATLDFVVERCAKALQACEQAMASSNGSTSLLAVDLACNGVWRVVAAALKNNLSSIFELGIASNIHKSYHSTYSFIEALAEAAGGGEYLSRRLRAHSSTLDLPWNLPVYFELVRVDALSKLDATLLFRGDEEEENGFVVVEERGGGGVAPSRFVSTLLKLVDKLWEPEPNLGGFFLKPTAHKSVELTYELVSKALRAATDRLDGGEDLSTLQLAQLALDSDTLELSLSQATPAKIANALRGHDLALPESAPVDAVVLAMDQSALRPARSLRKRALDRLELSLAEKTSNGLRAVKGVPARYNLTNEPAPNRPSDYVEADALSFLVDEFHAAWNPHLPPRFKPAVANRVMDNFAPMVTAVLDQAKKFQQSLIKRNKLSQQAATDYAKIAQQLLLDVEHLQARLLEDFCGGDGGGQTIRDDAADDEVRTTTTQLFDTTTFDRLRATLTTESFSSSIPS